MVGGNESVEFVSIEDSSSGSIWLRYKKKRRYGRLRKWDLKATYAMKHKSSPVSLSELA